LAVQGSEALSRLDFVRLEELLQSCAARSRELDLLDGATRKQVQLEAREAVAAMTIFARILEATRANLNVMQRLRDLRLGQLEYGSTPARQFTLQESRHGDH
jgi:hypothetical protein